MLMYGDRKKQVNLILGPREEEQPEAPDGVLRACVGEFMDAIHSKDIDGAMAALKSCFMELEASPHPEGPHTEE